MSIYKAYALAGRLVLLAPITQGVAMGYLLIGLSGRFQPHSTKLNTNDPYITFTNDKCYFPFRSGQDPVVN